MTRGLHRESLLNLHLVRQMFQAPTRKLARGIDAWWSYQKVIPITVAGFNPGATAIFHGKKSCFADWLADPYGSARDHNPGDFLVKEVLFAVHDYLHDWGYRLIAELRPDLGLGTAAITPDNLQALVFCHLMTEAIATVGLDYWYLSTFKLNDRVPIGTTRQTLTVSYHEDDRAEFRRFNPKLRVQTRAFFTSLVRFYCTGVFRGFDPHDLRRSPRTFRWLRHELTYGYTQRCYIRMWLRYFSRGRITLRGDQVSEPVAVDQPWQTRLIAEVAERLWHKVHDPRSTDTLPALDPARRWRVEGGRALDFRFENLNALPEARRAGAGARATADSFPHFFYQLLSSYDYEAFDLARMAKIEDIVRSKDAAAAARLVRGMQRVGPGDEEVRELLVLN